MDDTRIDKVELIHDGWNRFATVRLAEPDGTRFVRHVEDHGDAVCVLPYDPERRTVLLVRQLRAAALFAGEPARLLEAPAGLREESSTPEDCARREAMEEAGLLLRALQPLGCFWSMPGVSTERIHLFLASYRADDRVAAGGGLEEEHERIEVVEMPLDRAIAMVGAGEIADMKTALVLAALQLRHPELMA